jgi:hypothetical protein
MQLAASAVCRLLVIMLVELSKLGIGSALAL